MPRPYRTGENSRALAREVSAFVDQQLSNPELTLALAAGALGVSPRQVQRVLSSEHQTTWRALVLQQRMRRAKVLLAERKWTSRAVAAEVGYHQPSGFAKAFRRYWGEAPHQARGSLDPLADDDVVFVFVVRRRRLPDRR